MATFMFPFRVVAQLAPAFLLFLIGLVTSFAGLLFPAYVESFVIAGVGVILTFIGFFAIMLSMWSVSHG